MSSWLTRVARCYNMSLQDLLKYDLGRGHEDDLDYAPPLSLLTTLNERSGVAPGRLRHMSFAGWMPWLFDSLDSSDPSALETYVFQLSVLLPKGMREQKMHAVICWRAWLPPMPIVEHRRACPICVKDGLYSPMLLMWRLPLLLSCPTHGCWLESYEGSPGRFRGWENNPCEPKHANEAITAMDRRTWQALTAGYVDLPRRKVHAGVWFRLLRTLLNELNTPVSWCGDYGLIIRRVWDRCLLPLRARQRQWRPFEVLNIEVQLQMLEAAATAIEMIESWPLLGPGGESAELFRPEPYGVVDNDWPIQIRRSDDTATAWKTLAWAVEMAFIEARHNRETARFLFRFLANRRNDPARLEKLRAMFIENQVPPEFLADFVPEKILS